VLSCTPAPRPLAWVPGASPVAVLHGACFLVGPTAALLARSFGSSSAGFAEHPVSHVEGMVQLEFHGFASAVSGTRLLAVSYCQGAKYAGLPQAMSPGPSQQQPGFSRAALFSVAQGAPPLHSLDTGETAPLSWLRWKEVSLS
jgi:hypothetical protein